MCILHYSRNIYHVLAAGEQQSHLELLKHVLEKLPLDVTSNLLTQQSRTNRDTVSQSQCR